MLEEANKLLFRQDSCKYMYIYTHIYYKGNRIAKTKKKRAGDMSSLFSLWSTVTGPANSKFGNKC